MEPMDNHNQIIADFQKLHTALIDASSIIYMKKAGFLDMLVQTIDVLSLPEILNETGFTIHEIKFIESPKKNISNDDMLISAAREFQLTVISEDKKILKRAHQKGLSYYNSLMMLNYLFFIDVINNSRYMKYLNALKSFARYSTQIMDYGSAVFLSISEFKQNNSHSFESEHYNRM